MEGLKNKCRNEDFVNEIKNTHIVGLTETWLRAGDERAIEGYTLIVSRYQNRRASKGRFPGGVAVYARNDIAPNVKSIDDTSACWIRVCCGSTVNVGFFYRQPSDSILSDPNFFMKVGSDVELVRSRHEGEAIIMLGDMNGRTAALTGIESKVKGRECDEVAALECVIPYRVSKDTKVNKYGKELLRFSEEFDFFIINGTTPGDGHGEFTFVSHNGPSVIDYALVCTNGLSYVDDFRVLSSSLAQHFPIELLLSDPSLLPPPSQTREAEADGRGANQDTTVQLKKLRVKGDDDTRDAIKTRAASMVTLFLANILAVLSGGPQKLRDSIPSCVLAPVQSCWSAADVLHEFMRTLVAEKPKRSKDRSNTQTTWFTATCLELKGAMNRALRWFRADSSRLQFYLETRKEYKDEVSRAWKDYNKTIEDKIKEAHRSGDARTLFGEIKKHMRRNNPRKAQEIPGDSWLGHFKSILSMATASKQDWVDNGTRGEHNDTLDGKITKREIGHAIDRLKTGKAPGVWGIPNILIKYCKDSLVSLLDPVFNGIMSSGAYPREWVIALIHPIHKGKGSTLDPGNYRGISLLPSLGKLLSKILSDRFTNWLVENNQDTDYQAGFKKSYSTTDQIFILNTLVSKTLSRRSGQLYCCFVDFKRAFDSVSRQALLYKLREAGVNNKFYEVLNSMYQNATFCIKDGKGARTAERPYTAGVFQGDILSPKLFTFFIKDIIDQLGTVNHHAPSLGEQEVHSLLFADDLVLISRTKIGLQRQLDKLQDYCRTWGLEVNEAKSMALVFRQTGKKHKIDKWYYAGKELKTVSDFRYLGMVFTANGTFITHVKSMLANARRALQQLLGFRWRFQGISVRTLTMLFDALVKPISLYGAEVYAPQLFSKASVQDLDVCHNKWCRAVLGVPVGTKTEGPLWELGRSKISTMSIICSLKYFFKLGAAPRNRLVFLALQEQRRLTAAGKRCWGSGIKVFLDFAGLGHLWSREVSEGENTKRLVKIVKERYLDIDHSELLSRMRSSKLLKDYATLKKDKRMSNYLSSVSEFGKRRSCSLFRLNCIWSLPIKRTTTDALRYECSRCSATFPKASTWSHFLYHCRRLPKCTLVCKPDPSSEKIFRFLGSPRTDESATARVCDRIFEVLSHPLAKRE